MILFIIDFDGTITVQNSHNLVSAAIKEDNLIAQDPEKQWEVFKTAAPVRSAATWKHLFETLLNNDHKVAIASFNAYGHLIFRYLKEIIGLEEATLEKITIEAWMPENPKMSNKNSHIQKIMDKTGWDSYESLLILVDDQDRHLSCAKDEGYTTIKANFKNGKHIDKILKKGSHTPVSLPIPSDLSPSSYQNVFSPPPQPNLLSNSETDNMKSENHLIMDYV